MANDSFPGTNTGDTHNEITSNELRNCITSEDVVQQAEIITTSQNRSLTSSLRRLITITFRRNSSCTSSTTAGKRSANRTSNKNRKRGIFITVDNRNNNGKASEGNANSNAENFSSKKSSDKNNSYKRINVENINSEHNINNKGGVQASLASLPFVSTTNNRSLQSRNSDASVQTDLNFPTSNKHKKEHVKSSASEREKFTRRSSQPQHASFGQTASKTSMPAISLGEPISLKKRNSQTSNNDSERITPTKETSTSQTQTPSTTSSNLPAPGNSKNNILTTNATSTADLDERKTIECPLCINTIIATTAPQLNGCKHRVCLDCMQRYIITEINHSRLNITCPMCSEPIHPNTIKDILQNEKYYLKYESFMLRRVLAAEPDARWCPAPDCDFVVLANGCASCPRLVCGRDTCKTAFCYHCKQEWHPNQTCSTASIQRNKHQLVNAYNISDLFEVIDSSNQQNSLNEATSSNRKTSKSSQAANSSAMRPDDIKECPVCASRIIKMNDGSCNHMTCSICLTEFCWLCMKEISDLHYFSPSGCTFWGKKPWSRKKKLLWQLGMLIGAPICIILIAGIAVPAIVIGIPVWAARKLHNRLEGRPFSKYKKNAIVTGGVLLSFVVSPVISAVALAIGIPILLGYVYGVVPLSLCRSSGGCLSGAPSLENIQNNLRSANIISGVAGSEVSRASARDGTSIDTSMSHKFGGDPSIGETSIYLSNISIETNSIGRVTNVEREDRESASNAALAGSIISATNQANLNEDGNSTRALAGSIMSKESGYTLIPAEVHTKTSPASQISTTSN